MPTPNTTSPRGANGGARSVDKPAAKASTRRSGSSASKGARAKGSPSYGVGGSWGARQGGSAQVRRSTTSAADRSAGALGDYAERAVLIPIGAALIARDRVLSSVNHTISNYSSPAKTQAQLRRFERRGATARNRLEREVRKARVRFERELRQRRRSIERTVSDLEDRRDSVTKNGTELAGRVQERVRDLLV
jgi:hypothetical protein